MSFFNPIPWIGLGHLYHVFVYNMNDKYLYTYDRTSDQVLLWHIAGSYEVMRVPSSFLSGRLWRDLIYTNRSMATRSLCVVLLWTLILLFIG